LLNKIAAVFTCCRNEGPNVDYLKYSISGLAVHIGNIISYGGIKKAVGLTGLKAYL